MMEKHFSTRLVLYPAAALLAVLTAVAQIPGGSGGPPQQQPMPGQQPQQAPYNPSAGTPADPTAPTQGSFADQAFVRNALEGSVAEVQLGQLAQQKSQSDDVKQYGQRMVQVHTQLDQQMKPVAKQLGVSEPKGPSKKQKQEIAKLEALSGPQFDEEYIKTMVKDHQKVVKDFKEEMQLAQDPNVKQIAQSDEPVFEQQLKVIEQIAEKHNVALEIKK
jgi:putative membrane protein